MRKLLTSILVTLILFVTLGSVSLAWVNLPRTNIIDDISFGAKTKTGLEISLDGIEYKNEIDEASINEIIRNINFKDMTSSDGITFESGYSKNSQIVKNRDYISFDIYFRTNETRRNVYLADNIKREEVLYDELKRFEEHTYIISKGINWRTNNDFWYGPELEDIRESGSVNRYYASDAIRISSIEKSPNAGYELEDPIIKIFDLSENETRGFGKEFGAIDYFKKVTGNNNIEIPDAPKVIYGLTKFDEYQIPDGDKSLITTLRYVDNSGYAKGKVTFNIWVEGWDADSFDAILGDKISIQLAFKSN